MKDNIVCVKDVASVSVEPDVIFIAFVVIQIVKTMKFPSFEVAMKLPFQKLLLRITRNMTVANSIIFIYQSLE